MQYRPSSVDEGYTDIFKGRLDGWDFMMFDCSGG